MPKRVPPKFRRLPTLNETASVLEPGAPEFITMEVSTSPGEEKKKIIYIRQDTLPEKLRKDVGKAVIEKCLGLPLFQTLGNLGQRILLGDDVPISTGNKTDGPSDPEGPDLATEGDK
jgi:hypothetical protein